MWAGQDACVLASGPSMSQAVADLVRYSAVRTIAVNNTFQLAPWADMLYAADERWWAVHQTAALKFRGLKVSVSVTQFTEVLVMNNTGTVGFDPNPANLRTGGNSGYQAVHIAVHAGVRRVLLCGFDLHGKHWHAEHQHPLRNNEEGAFLRWQKRFAELAVELKERKVEVWNCTPGTALACFERVELKDALQRIAEDQICALSA